MVRRSSIDAKSGDWKWAQVHPAGFVQPDVPDTILHASPFLGHKCDVSWSFASMGCIHVLFFMLQMLGALRLTAVYWPQPMEDTLLLCSRLC